MTALPVIDIADSIPWLAPGQILTRMGFEGTSTPEMLVLEVGELEFPVNRSVFKGRTCNVSTGKVGPTTTTYISVDKVGLGDSCEYRVIGTLCPLPKRGQTIKSRDGKSSFKVLSVSGGNCTVSPWGASKLISGESSREIKLNASFWSEFKVFWPKASKK